MIGGAFFEFQRPPPPGGGQRQQSKGSTAKVTRLRSSRKAFSLRFQLEHSPKASRILRLTSSGLPTLASNRVRG